MDRIYNYYFQLYENLLITIKLNSKVPSTSNYSLSFLNLLKLVKYLLLKNYFTRIIFNEIVINSARFLLSSLKLNTDYRL